VAAVNPGGERSFLLARHVGFRLVRSCSWLDGVRRQPPSERANRLSANVGSARRPRRLLAAPPPAKARPGRSSRPLRSRLRLAVSPMLRTSSRWLPAQRPGRLSSSSRLRLRSPHPQTPKKSRDGFSVTRSHLSTWSSNRGSGEHPHRNRTEHTHAPTGPYRGEEALARDDEGLAGRRLVAADVGQLRPCQAH